VIVGFFVRRRVHAVAGIDGEAALGDLLGGDLADEAVDQANDLSAGDKFDVVKRGEGRRENNQMGLLTTNENKYILCSKCMIYKFFYRLIIGRVNFTDIDQGELC
jgi:hypothetical protein